jgi:hypothetical protein
VQAVAGELVGCDIVAHLAAFHTFDQQLTDERSKVVLGLGDVLTRCRTAASSWP